VKGPYFILQPVLYDSENFPQTRFVLTAVRTTHMTTSIGPNGHSASAPAAPARSDSDPADSEILRTQCTDLVKRLFPDQGNVGDCSPNDINKLLALFYRNRFARRRNAPRLPRRTNFYALNKLITGAPFHDYHPKTGLIDMQRYLKLLAEAFRSFKEDGTAVEHVNRLEWYSGLNKLDGICQRARKKCPPDLQIELWDVAFLIKHCNYLLIGIEDSYSLAENLVEKGGVVLDGALNGYGNQWVQTKDNLFTLLKRERSPEKWHKSYIELEERWFDVFAARFEESVESVPQKEVDITIALRNKLEDELALGSQTGRSYTLNKMMKTVVGKTTKVLQASGPYEENAEYFKYGILDLMYKASFWIQNRDTCFEEMIGAIQHVLERSHKSANLLHRKAIELYNRILELGKDDEKVYGRAEELKFIELWKVQHSKEVESPEVSKRCSQSLIS
jgi:hypothetical protein